MWLETMVTQLSDVSRMSTRGLAGLRAHDRASRDLVNALHEEEDALFNELKEVQKLKGSDFDESSFINKAKDLMKRRSNLIVMLEEQGKCAQSIYDIIDKKIELFDKRTESIADLLAVDPNETLSKHKKKKRKAQTEGPGEEIVIDPNEPVYCTCRMVSFGKMIGCENAECPIEWFHLNCVGIPENAVPDAWYCYDCKEKLGMTNK